MDDGRNPTDVALHMKDYRCRGRVDALRRGKARSAYERKSADAKLDTIGHAEFGKQVGDIVAYGVLAYAERPCDFLVSPALGQLKQDLAFARRDVRFASCHRRSRFGETGVIFKRKSVFRQGITLSYY